MGKKKSRSQKQRQNKKRKLKKELVTTNIQQVESSNNLEVKEEKHHEQVVLKENVIYNVALTKTKKNNKNRYTKYFNIIKEKVRNILDKIEDVIPKREVTFEVIKTKIRRKNKRNLVNNKEVSNEIVRRIMDEEIELPKLAKTKKELIPSDSDNKFIQLLYKLKINTHIIFNSLLIICFLLLLVGLIKSKTLGSGIIIYISILIIFLILVAISHNRYLSGKVFSLLLCLGMACAIGHLQYTYDFIRNLNSYKYEYKTYYLVTFNTNINKSIYNINNKKVGLLSNNSTNIERMLDSKLDKVEYIEYDDINSMFDNFYNREFRAVVVNDNEYKYLVNNEATGAKSVKVLYEFKVNALK